MNPITKRDQCQGQLPTITTPWNFAQKLDLDYMAA